MQRETMYMDRVTDAVEPGNVVVHNHVYPAARTNGTRGSRFWQEPPGDYLEPCPCEWAPELGEHYRVAGVGPEGSPRKTVKR
jgi:hypothetical protein